MNELMTVIQIHINHLLIFLSLSFPYTWTKGREKTSIQFDQWMKRDLKFGLILEKEEEEGGRKMRKRVGMKWLRFCAALIWYSWYFALKSMLPSKPGSFATIPCMVMRAIYATSPLAVIVVYVLPYLYGCIWLCNAQCACLVMINELKLNKNQVEQEFELQMRPHW